MATLQETARRICAAKGIDLAGTGVFWGTELPRLAHAADLGVLRDLLTELELGVVIIDPAYLAMLAGAPQIQASNLFQMGPILSDFSRACLDAGATPILAHHSLKHRDVGSRYEPLELEELAFAGFQEFARQWCLISRRARYDPGTGIHRLWFGVGGSAGFSNSWGVDVEEGVVDDRFAGRRRGVTVRTVAELRAAEQDERERKKQDEWERVEVKAREAILHHLRRPENRDGDSLTGLAHVAGVHKAGRVRPIVVQMAREGTLLPVSRLEKGNRKCAGYRIADTAGEDDD
jgi:hypothetical protein